MTVAMSLILVLAVWAESTGSLSESTDMRTIKLPAPRHRGNTSVEEALAHRRSVREYTRKPLSLNDISQLLWSAQGITNRQEGFRTAPSAGALYPLHIYLVAGNVDSLSSGVYEYVPADHSLLQLRHDDIRTVLSEAALDQESVRDAAACFVVCARYETTTRKYGDRGIRYVHMEVGHVAQNIYLQTASLGLGTVSVGAFHDDAVRAAIGLSDRIVPLLIMPVGRK